MLRARPPKRAVPAFKPSLGGAPPKRLWRIRSPFTIALLFLLTAGLYGTYWSYFVFKEVADHNDGEHNKALCLIGTTFTLVLPVGTAVSLSVLWAVSGRVRFSDGLSFALLFGVFSVLGLVMMTVYFGLEMDNVREAKLRRGLPGGMGEEAFYDMVALTHGGIIVMTPAVIIAAVALAYAARGDTLSATSFVAVTLIAFTVAVLWLAPFVVMQVQVNRYWNGVAGTDDSSMWSAPRF